MHHLLGIIAQLWYGTLLQRLMRYAGKWKPIVPYCQEVSGDVKWDMKLDGYSRSMRQIYLKVKQGIDDGCDRLVHKLAVLACLHDGINSDTGKLYFV